MLRHHWLRCFRSRTHPTRVIVLLKAKYVSCTAPIGASQSLPGDCDGTELLTKSPDLRYGHSPSLPKPLLISSIRTALFYNQPAKQSQKFGDLDSNTVLNLPQSYINAPGVDTVQQVKYIAANYLSSLRDGIQLVSRFPTIAQVLGQSQTVAEAENILRTLNLIVSRLSLLKIPLDRNIICYGIHCATKARSTIAFRHYISQLAQDQLQLDLSETLGVLKNLVLWAEQDNFEGWDGSRRRQELLYVISGQIIEGFQISRKEKQANLRECMARGNAQAWDRFLYVIGKISGKDALSREWQMMKPSSGEKSVRSTEDTTQQDRNSYSGHPGAEVTNSFIQHLLASNGPEEAWKVVTESSCKAEALDDLTWNSLLDYPEYLTEWEPGMAEPLLKKYEQEILKIEAALGIKWTGGENGSHVSPLVRDEEDCDD